MDNLFSPFPSAQARTESGNSDKRLEIVDPGVEISSFREDAIRAFCI